MDTEGWQRSLMTEIIETYWNVNLFFFMTVLYQEYRNNRNILECKLLSLPFHPTLGIEIIETYWNVNA